MMRSAEDVQKLDFMRVLMQGPTKAGKTTVAATTCIGRPYIINSDDEGALSPVERRTDAFDWEYAPGTDNQRIEMCLMEASKNVKEGRTGTVIWDTITEYSRRSVDYFEENTKKSQGAFWYDHRRHIQSIIDRLLRLKAHVIIIAHYREESEPGATPKKKIQLPGQLAETVRTMIPNCIFLDKKAGKRIFVTSTDGVYGPGCRNLEGVESCEADISKLWAMMRETDKKEGNK